MGFEKEREREIGVSDLKKECYLGFGVQIDRLGVRVLERERWIWCQGYKERDGLGVKVFEREREREKFGVRILYRQIKRNIYLDRQRYQGLVD